MGQGLRLVRVSWNFENIQNLAVLHGLVKEVRFPYTLAFIYYYALQIYDTNEWV